MSKSRKQILRERFQEIYDKEPEDILDYEPSERDLEIAVRINSDQFTSLILTIQAEEALNQIDEEHLSEESRNDVRQTRAMLEFNKKVGCARYGKHWSEIRDLFLAGMYDELEESYSEDWGWEELQKYEVETP